METDLPEIEAGSFAAVKPNTIRVTMYWHFLRLKTTIAKLGC